MAASIYSQNCFGHGLICIKFAFLIFSQSRRPHSLRAVPSSLPQLADGPVQASLSLLSQPKATHSSLASQFHLPTQGQALDSFLIANHD